MSSRPLSIPQVQMTACDAEDSFVSPPSSMKSVLKWSSLQQNMTTPAAPTNDMFEPLDQRSLILHMDRLQRDQREQTERQSAESMDEAVHSLAVMLPADELDTMQMGGPAPRWRHVPREVVQQCSTCMSTPRRRYSTGRRACRCVEETCVSSDTLFFSERLSDSTRFLLQLPQDSQTFMDFSSDEDDDDDNGRPSAFHRIHLRPKMSMTRCHSDPEPLEASAQLPTTAQTSASSSSAGSPHPPPLDNYRYIPSYPVHGQGRMVMPLLPMMTPENSKPTAQLFLDGAPEMTNFQTPPPSSRRKFG
jgi:hypothetical protein